MIYDYLQHVQSVFEMQATKKGMRELKKQNVFLMKNSHAYCKWINVSNF